MLRPKEVSDYLPMMEEVADDFIEKLGRLRKNDGKIDGFFNEVAKWNLECQLMSRLLFLWFFCFLREFIILRNTWQCQLMSRLFEFRF